MSNRENYYNMYIQTELETYAEKGISGNCVYESIIEELLKERDQLKKQIAELKRGVNNDRR
jgi:flagellar biosynthesis chaperone FliJ